MYKVDSVSDRVLIIKPSVMTGRCHNTRPWVSNSVFWKTTNICVITWYPVIGISIKRSAWSEAFKRIVSVHSSAVTLTLTSPGLLAWGPAPVALCVELSWPS